MNHSPSPQISHVTRLPAHLPTYLSNHSIQPLIKQSFFQHSDPIANKPLWNHAKTKLEKGFQEVWYLKFNLPNTEAALWLRFTLLSSSNQFRQVAELWGIYFDHQNGVTSKTGLKQTFSISAASAAAFK